MAKPLLVNISGMRRIGVSCACDRAARSLNTMGLNTVIIKLSTGGECADFADDLILGKYDGVHVVLFDKHFYTETAARRNLSHVRWHDDDIGLDLSVLLTPSQSHNDQHKAYFKIDQRHYGTPNHHVINVDGKHGKLYAAGNIKKLILRELGR